MNSNRKHGVWAYVNAFIDQAPTTWMSASHLTRRNRQEAAGLQRTRAPGPGWPRARGIHIPLAVLHRLESARKILKHLAGCACANASSLNLSRPVGAIFAPGGGHFIKLASRLIGTLIASQCQPMKFDHHVIDQINAPNQAKNQDLRYFTHFTLRPALLRPPHSPLGDQPCVRMPIPSGAAYSRAASLIRVSGGQSSRKSSRPGRRTLLVCGSGNGAGADIGAAMGAVTSSTSGGTPRTARPPGSQPASPRVGNGTSSGSNDVRGPWNRSVRPRTGPRLLMGGAGGMWVLISASFTSALVTMSGRRGAR